MSTIYVFEPDKPTPSMAELRAPAVRTGPLKEDGALIEDGIQKATTHRCPHCGGHFLLAKGNFDLAKTMIGNMARPKVFCVKCDKLTCGRDGCNPTVVGCIPVEARLEFAEGKRNIYTDAILELQAKGLPVL